MGCSCLCGVQCHRQSPSPELELNQMLRSRTRSHQLGWCQIGSISVSLFLPCSSPHKRRGTLYSIRNLGAGPGGGARPSENPSEAQPPRSGGPEVARAANSGVGGGQSQGPGAGGASPLNGGDGTAVGSGDGKRVGSTPRGAGGAARTPRGPVASI